MDAQNDLVHGWGIDIKIGYCAQVCTTVFIKILYVFCILEMYFSWTACCASSELNSHVFGS
jgi:hypothetical protein